MRAVTDDPRKQEMILRGVLHLTSQMDLKDSPPSMGKRIHSLIREASRNSDPYLAIKERCNRFAHDLMPWARRTIESASDPFECAVRLAIAGNILDFGVQRVFDEESARKIIEGVLHAPIDLDAIRQLHSEVAEAKKILYLGDNAGEIFFDRLLIEQLPCERVTFAVRGAPILNDVTRADAVTCGLTEMVNVIDSGSDAPGTILEDCSVEFRAHFTAADRVIAKGQGNYETLSDEDAPIWFLLKAKCPVIAQDLRCENGALIVRWQHPTGGEQKQRSILTCQETEKAGEDPIIRH